MYGFIVSSHYDFYDTITKCLNLLFKYIPDNSFVLLYVNEPKGNKMLNIENDYKQEKQRFKVIFIEDQNKNGGLSGVWNQGIDFFLYPDSFDYVKFPILKNFKCKVITILGHDTYINENIRYLLKAGITAQNNNELKYFGPLYKSYSNCSEPWQDISLYKSYQELENNYLIKYLIGALLTIPVNSLMKNVTIDANYFNARKYPFAGNEVDWHKRFIKEGGKAEIITECVIDHISRRTWNNLE